MALMTDRDSRPKLSVYDMFPDARLDRIQPLLETAYFRALVALDSTLQLGRELRTQQPDNKVIQQLVQDQNDSFVEAKRGIYLLLQNQGYTQNEISAACMVKEGRIVLKRE